MNPAMLVPILLVIFAGGMIALQAPTNAILARAAAALSLPWYADERAVDALKQATQDADEIVSRAAKWALQALQATLLNRKQSGM